VWINGREVTLPALRKIEKEGDRLVPLVVDLTSLLQPGDNLIVLAAIPLRGKTFAGAAGLYRKVAPPAPPTLKEVAPCCYTVDSPCGLDRLVIGAEQPVKFANWETDAWCALLDAREGAALGATYCSGDGMAFHGTRANVAWSDGAFDCGELHGETEFCCLWAGGNVHVEAHGVMRIDGRDGLQVSWIADHAVPVFVNGKPVDPVYDPISRRSTVTLDSVEEPAGEETPARWSHAIMLALEPGDAARHQLEALLHDRAWPVRCAAALSLGRRHDRAAVPALLAVLREEMAGDNYPPLTWQITEVAPALAPADPNDDVPQERYLKRWHVVMCCAVALGNLGDRAAVPALCAILDRQVDFYPALANAAWALGVLGDPAAIPALEAYRDYYEINAQTRAREALAKFGK
jgi:hypothetical protein